MNEPTALAAGLGRRNPRLAPSAHYPRQTFRGEWPVGEGMSPGIETMVRRLQDPSPPDPLSPKRGEGEKELGIDSPGARVAVVGRRRSGLTHPT